MAGRTPARGAADFAIGWGVRGLWPRGGRSGARGGGNFDGLCECTVTWACQNDAASEAWLRLRLLPGPMLRPAGFGRRSMSPAYSGSLPRFSPSPVPIPRPLRILTHEAAPATCQQPLPTAHSPPAFPPPTPSTSQLYQPYLHFGGVPYTLHQIAGSMVVACHAQAPGRPTRQIRHSSGYRGRDPA